MNRVAFILDQFELQSPGQQLLDRFLIGYKHDGAFNATPAKVMLSMPKADENPMIQGRQSEFDLEIARSIESAASSADLLVLAPGTRKYLEARSIPLHQVLSARTPKQSVFIDGSILPPQETLRSIQSQIIVSQAAAHLFPLPVRPVFRPAGLRRALVVVQGLFPQAEIDALFALKPYLDPSWTQTSIPTIQHLQDDKLWNFVYSSDWRPLLQAAISRSNNIKGDPEKDGRTQDIVGLQLLEKLARTARGWHLQNTDGIQTLVLVCDDALTDFNFALEADGQIHSAQLYHGQSPMENHYDEMAAWILEQFTNPSAPGHFVLSITDIANTMKSLKPPPANS